MDKIKIAIVEDEVLAQKQLASHIQSYMEKNALEYETIVFDGGTFFLENYHGGFDLIFMDVMMPDLDGMETARRLRKIDQDVLLIFVTSLAQYALKGYEVDALDFMLKPVEIHETFQKLDKARRFLERFSSVTIPLEYEGGFKLVNVKAITFVEVYNHSLIFHTDLGDFSMHGQLKELELDSRYCSFLRCNSCYLVNAKRITKVLSDSVEIGKVSLAISRRKKKDFLENLTRLSSGGLV